MKESPSFIKFVYQVINIPFWLFLHLIRDQNKPALKIVLKITQHVKYSE